MFDNIFELNIKAKHILSYVKFNYRLVSPWLYISSILKWFSHTCLSRPSPPSIVKTVNSGLKNLSKLHTLQTRCLGIFILLSLKLSYKCRLTVYLETMKQNKRYKDQEYFGPHKLFVKLQLKLKHCRHTEELVLLSHC